MILGIILGIVFAACFSYMAIMILVQKSNDAGDSTGTFYNFAEGTIEMLDRQDGIDPYRFL